MIRLGPGGVALAGLAVLAALGMGLARFAAHHYDRGFAARGAEMQAALDAAQARLDALADLARDRAQALARAETETQTLMEALSDEADLDPDGIRLSADSVRRLNAVAGQPAPAPAPR